MRHLTNPSATRFASNLILSPDWLEHKQIRKADSTFARKPMKYDASLQRRLPWAG